MQSSQNEQIAEWLVRLTDNQRNWGFGLCFLDLCNVKGFGWNHKRVYRIYRELELNLRIRPKKRLLRETPTALTVPQAMKSAKSCNKTPRCYRLRLAYYRFFFEYAGERGGTVRY